MPDCEHIITTDPNVIKNEFPAIYELCQKGAKYRVQHKKINKSNIYDSIESFRARIEKKYGTAENELLS